MVKGKDEQIRKLKGDKELEGQPASKRVEQEGAGEGEEVTKVKAEGADRASTLEEYEREEGGSTPEIPKEAEIAALKEELAAKQREIEELRSQLLRLQADFDNYRKRVRRDQQEIKETAAVHLIKELLPVMDSLELALQAARAGGDKDSLVTGIQMVGRQLSEILHREGLTEVKAVGQPFDPTYHEAVATEEAGEAAQHNLVMAELRKGYLLRGRLLRPALVKVAVAASATQGEQNQRQAEKIEEESGDE
jgi:molecular chaperone GrpE